MTLFGQMLVTCCSSPGRQLQGPQSGLGPKEAGSNPWDVCIEWCNLIEAFYPSLPSLQTHIHPSPLSFKFMSAFALIVIACIHVFVYTCIFLDITCWVHIMLPFCMFSGLIVWHWTVSVLFLEGDHVSLSQLSLVLCRVEALWASGVGGPSVCVLLLLINE